jgi:hypothetical protein
MGGMTGDDVFTLDDLCELSELVAATWTEAVDRDWAAPAGTLEWSCLATADHAVDCVYAPVFFLGSRRLDAYPQAGLDLALGDIATPTLLVESLQIATRMLVALVKDTPSDVRSILFYRPAVTGGPADFAPRAALELALHAHDVCAGLGEPFQPPAGICQRLRDHTRDWPFWTYIGAGLGESADPWSDLLTASGR